MADSEKKEDILSRDELGDVITAWDFPEHEPHERGRRWYVISALLIVGLLLFAYYDNNPLLAVIVILAVIAFLVSELRGPDTHTFVMTEDGVLVGDIFFDYDELKNFYVIYKPPFVKMLYLQPKSMLRQRIGVPLLDQDPVTIREILLNYLPEDLEKEDEPTSDFLGRIFKI